jgi:hypothetical protein
MPVGGVQVAAEAKECEVTIIVLATVVVTSGVAWVRPLAVFCPSSTSIGVVVSTPVNVWIPPAEPVEVLNVQE